MQRSELTEVLKKYLPEKAVEQCASWIVMKNIHLRISRNRSSKYGDYRPLEKGKGHRITVNYDLNPYAFLITFIHEVAHLNTYVKCRHYHEPHGKEWKQEFSYLLHDFMLQGIFPDDIAMALSKYIRNPSASSCTDHDLLRILKKYDVHQKNGEIMHLEDLPEQSLFRLYLSRSKLIFRKGPMIRKRFHCIEVATSREYYVSPLAEVKKITNENF